MGSFKEEWKGFKKKVGYPVITEFLLKKFKSQRKWILSIKKFFS